MRQEAQRKVERLEKIAGKGTRKKRKATWILLSNKDGSRQVSNAQIKLAKWIFKFRISNKCKKTYPALYISRTDALLGDVFPLSTRGWKKLTWGKMRKIKKEIEGK